MKIIIAKLFQRLFVVTIVFAPSIKADVFESSIENEEVREAFNTHVAYLQSKKTISGRFIQKKYLQLLTRPIESNGRFDYQSDRFFWLLESPIVVSYSVSKDAIIIKDEQGERPVTQRRDPLLHGFFTIFLQVLSAEFDGLEKYFTIFYHQDGESWQVGLKPKSQIVGNAIDYLLISGKNDLEQLTLVEPGGDKSEIRFLIDDEFRISK